jgi:hypothetical protein
MEQRLLRKYVILVSTLVSTEFWGFSSFKPLQNLRLTIEGIVSLV